MEQGEHDCIDSLLKINEFLRQLNSQQADTIAALENLENGHTKREMAVNDIK